MISLSSSVFRSNWYLFLFVFLLMPNLSHAQIFPRDALNYRTDLRGNGTTTLISVSGTYTLLYESFNTGSHTANASLTIACYPLILLKINDFSNVPQVERFKQAKCTSDITASLS